MEDLTDVAFAVGAAHAEGKTVTHAACIDVKDAFLHVPLSPHFEKYLGFSVGDKWYRATALPFGLQSSPLVWQRFVNVVLARVRAKGVVACVHVDDLVLLGSSADEVARAVNTVLHELVDAGILPNLPKSTLAPSPVVEYLGFILDFTNPSRPVVRVPLEKRRKVRQDLARLSTAERCTPRRVASVLGKFRALAPAIPHACLLSFRLQQSLSRMLKHTAATTDLQHNQHQHQHLQQHQRRPHSLQHQRLPHLHLAPPWQSLTKAHWDTATGLSRHARQNSLELSRLLKQPAEAPLQLPQRSPSHTISTDASDTRWGAVLHRQTTIAPFGGYFSEEEQRLHITAKETLAVLRTLQSLSPHLPDHALLLLQVDAQSLYFALKKLKTRSARMHAVLAEIHSLCLLHDWTIRPVWIPTEENEADAPSRAGRDWDDYRLRPDLLRTAREQLRVDKPTLDLMASQQNAQTRRFCSATPQPGAVLLDVFSRPLSHHSDKTLYCNPPWGAIQRLLLHAQTMRHDQQLILVTPRWELQPWWTHLARVRTRHLTLPPSTPPYVDPLGRPMPCPRWSSDISVISGSTMLRPERTRRL